MLERFLEVSVLTTARKINDQEITRLKTGADTAIFLTGLQYLSGSKQQQQ